jgi:hypothetical protein
MLFFFYLFYLLNRYLTKLLLKLTLTELLYRCNCSKAEATFALGRDLVGKQEGRSSRSDEDLIKKLLSLLMEHLLKVTGGSSWKVEESKNHKQLDPQFRKPPGLKALDMYKISQV